MGTGSLQFHSPTTDTSVAKPLNENEVMVVEAGWEDACTSLEESGENTTRTIRRIKKRATVLIPHPPNPFVG